MIKGRSQGRHRSADKNIVLNPMFVDAANQNFQIKDDSPAFSLNASGFQRIPLDKIGLDVDAQRAAWAGARPVRAGRTDAMIPRIS